MHCKPCFIVDILCTIVYARGELPLAHAPKAHFGRRSQDSEINRPLIGKDVSVRSKWHGAQKVRTENQSGAHGCRAQLSLSRSPLPTLDYGLGFSAQGNGMLHRRRVHGHAINQVCHVSQDDLVHITRASGSSRLSGRK